MQKIKMKSAIPIYLAAAVWLLVGLLRPTMLLRMKTLIATAALSIAAYGVGSLLFKGKWIEVREKADTGNVQIDRQIAEAGRILDRLEGYKGEISNQDALKCLSRMCESGNAVLEVLKQAPDKASMARRFMNYYLPTVDKIMGDYASLLKSPVRGEHIQSAIASVEENLSMVADAFDHQLDSLYRDKSFDMDAELTVLETILKSEGLSGKRDFAQDEEKNDDAQQVRLGV